ncbi:MAG TPA: CxxxxCH/CxxCH domain-containing protein [bacterium]|jgi:predicted CxxxxCH...CXXCH cytochrome family protein
MRKTNLFLSLIALSAMLMILWGCSEVAEEGGIESPHPDGWMNPSSGDFHGELVSLSELEGSSCAGCHGTDQSGGTSGLSCYDCHHAEGWADPEVHGYSVISDSGRADDCADCHRTDVNGEEVWSCWNCHRAFPHADSLGLDGHLDLMHEANYQVWICKPCHGEDYSGGVAEASCLECHQNSPEACNTCHGDYNGDPQQMSSWAPPLDLANNTSTDSITTGTHISHVNPVLREAPWVGGPYSCNECHVLPLAVNSAGHLDDQAPQAEVVFGWIATDRNSVYPVWDRENGTCTDTYCHGNFALGNPDNPVPVWTDMSALQLECGSCHLIPPPLPHIQNYDCHLCHGNVIGPDNLTIIAPENHANGDVN